MSKSSFPLHPPLDPMPPIPWGPNHPGAFGICRHEHVHTGVDLYAPVGCPVYAIEEGKVIAIEWFTGPSINMPWWNDTRAVYIEGETGVYNYGEIQEMPWLKIGDTVKAGDVIGYIVPVLKKYKGRPMSMLHIELYDHGYKDDWSVWKIGDPKPEHLKDPTYNLFSIPHSTMKEKDPYENSARAWKDFQDKYGGPGTSTP
jgi:hypothetical protein